MHVERHARALAGERAFMYSSTMLPEKHVWVFNAERGAFPGAVFSTLEHAERWIRSNRVSGVLTAYPLDEGCFDWAVRNDLVTGRARFRGNEPAFVGQFTSAAQDHHHFENGEPR